MYNGFYEHTATDGTLDGVHRSHNYDRVYRDGSSLSTVS